LPQHLLASSGQSAARGLVRACMLYSSCTAHPEKTRLVCGLAVRDF
jgi:hypothetical protein